MPFLLRRRSLLCYEGCKQLVYVQFLVVRGWLLGIGDSGRGVQGGLRSILLVVLRQASYSTSRQMFPTMVTICVARHASLQQGYCLTCLVPALVVICGLVTGCCRLIGIHRQVLQLMSWDCGKQGLRVLLLLLLDLQAAHVS